MNEWLSSHGPLVLTYESLTLSKLAATLSSQVCHQRGLLELGNLRMYVTVLRIINSNKQLDKCGDTWHCRNCAIIILPSQ